MRLKSGWWAFECRGRVVPETVELRLRSSADPLIAVPAGEAIRLYLRAEEPYDVSVLVSVWPGRRTFDVLTLRRLNAFETISLLAAGAMRALSRPNAAQILVQLLRRFIARQALGTRTASVTPPAVAARARSSGTPGEPAGEAYCVLSDAGVSAILLSGDELDARAFGVVQAEFERRPELKAIYSDVEEEGVTLPRPGWDDELAKANAYVDAPVFLREIPAGDPWTALVSTARSFGAGAVGRIALPLARRAKQHRSKLARSAAPELAAEPLVSVIIPTKYQVDLLERNLASLTGVTGYPNLEIIVIDNGCEDPRFPEMLKSFSAKASLKHLRDLGGFNFSRLVNNGAAAASGEVLLLLNDDVEAIEPGWLHRMIASAMTPDVGAVGARLLYPDGAIQHAGVVLGVGGIAGHLWKGLSSAEAEQNPYVTCPSTRMAVTGACLAVRRELYRLIGGFDEAFAVALNDIDFCLRLRQEGHRTVYRGDAVLIHHEGRSRGADDRTILTRRRLASETKLFLARWRNEVLDDPFGSPAFDLTSEVGRVHRALMMPAATALE